jgi:hypothetical protein
MTVPLESGGCISIRQFVICLFCHWFTFMFVCMYVSTYRISWPIRRTMIFSLEILEKNDDECILILVIYWKKTGLLHILLQESKPFTSSDARSHDLEANFAIS